ncbi:MAG: GWxTD domain-containing protein [Bacteroidota bacterium]
MKFFYRLFTFLLFTGIMCSQTVQPKLRLSIDYSRFRGDSANSYLEIYYSFSDRGLQLQKTGDGFKTGVIMTARVLNSKKDSIIFQKRWRVPRSFADSASNFSGQDLVGVVAMAVPKGDYFLNVKGQDEYQPANIDSVVYSLNSNPVKEGAVTISDVELCSSIKESAAKENIFYKNTLEVVPNPSLLFGIGMPVIFYYVEVYNLIKDMTIPHYYTRSSVYNNSGKEILHQQRKKLKSNESSVELGTINISKLPNGTYTFFFSLTDSSGTPKFSAGKKFYVYNPHIVDSASLKTASLDVLSSEYAAMSAEELDKEFQQAVYVATPEEKDRYEELKEINAKRKFIFDFWRMRDNDPTTEVNEFKEEYMKRIEYANNYFRAMSRPGYKTDRGRVYCVYGPPDEVQRHPNEGDYRPYEIWDYNSIQGGVIFVFVDRSGFSDYQLVHSTHRNEIQDENWEQKALMMPTQ